MLFNMKRLGKILSWIILSLLLLVTALLLFIQTPWFRNIVKQQIVKTANNNINGKLSIGSLQGNFFTNLKITNLTLELKQGDTLGHIETLALHYSPLFLLKKELRINSFFIEKPELHLSMNSDSTWNFDQLLLATDTITDEKTDSGPFPLTIVLSKFSIVNGKIRLQDNNNLTPTSIDSLNIDLSFLFSEQEMRASLKHLGLQMKQPDFFIQDFRVDAHLLNETWKISNLFLLTGQNQLKANAGYKGSQNFNIDFLWNNIHTEEFAFVLPTIIIPANPDVSLQAENINNRLELSFDVAHKGQSLSLAGTINHLDYLMADSLRHLAPVDLTLQVKDLNPNSWMELPPIPLVLNTTLRLTGNGLKQGSVPLNISANLAETLWENHRLDKGNLEASYLAGKTSATLDLAGLFGSLHLKTDLNLNDHAAPFTGNLKTNQLTLHKLLPTLIDSTCLTTDITTSGTGLGSDSLQASFKGTISQSLVEYVGVDSLFLMGSFINGDLKLDTLTLRNKSLDLNLNGFYGHNGQIRALLTSNLYNTCEFEHYFDNPAQWEQTYLWAEASGTIDSIAFNLMAGASEITMDSTLQTGKLDLNGNGSLVNQKLFAKTHLKLTKIKTSSIELDSVNLETAVNDSLWQVHLASSLPNNINLILEARGNMADTIQATIDQLEFNAPYTALHLNNAPARITYNNDYISLQNFSIVDKLDSAVVITARAMAAWPDSVTMSLSLKELNLGLLQQAQLTEQEIKGRTSLDLNLFATQQQIDLSANTWISHIEAAPLSIASVKADLNYVGDTLFFRSVISAPNDSVLLTAQTPLTAKLNDSLTISWPKTIRARLKASNTHLDAFFDQLPVASQPHALLNMDLNTEGPIDDPEIMGFVDISKGELPLSQYGINYKDLRLKLLVNGTTIQLDTLFASHLKGTLLASGSFRMDSSLLSGNIISSDVQLKADRFYLTKHRNHEVQINANVYFKDKDKMPQFGGNLQVLRSSFYLPALTDMSSGSSSLGNPLLVQALQKEQEVVITDTLQLPEITRQEIPFMDKLTGTLKVDIPRNTWIKSDDMQMELYGNLDVVKTGAFFELFGNVGIHRGFYTLYGKKLIIREGEFVFTGGEAFNPMVNLKADYVFRTRDREKKELLLSVSGTATNPQIAFELDDQPIPEADAMAYLLFGQPFDQLSYGNQEGVSNAIPSRMVSGLLSSQLSRTLGNTLKLDMIEIDAGDNWQNTTFMVGKYITNDLFVTYRKSFGEEEGQDISPEVITMEYELSRRFSVRLIHGDVKDSGIDIILKFEK